MLKDVEFAVVSGLKHATLAPVKGPVTINVSLAKHGCLDALNSEVAFISNAADVTFLSEELCMELEIPMTPLKNDCRRGLMDVCGKPVQQVSLIKSLVVYVEHSHGFVTVEIAPVHVFPTGARRLQLGKDFLRRAHAHFYVKFPNGMLCIAEDGMWHAPEVAEEKLIMQVGKSDVCVPLSHCRDHVLGAVECYGTSDNMRSCAACGNQAFNLKVCQGCKGHTSNDTYYCTKECQKAHWRIHKKNCVNPSKQSISKPASVLDVLPTSSTDSLTIRTIHQASNLPQDERDEINCRQPPPSASSVSSCKESDMFGLRQSSHIKSAKHPMGRGKGRGSN